ncbi:hypothetical+protein [Methylocapsa aurea]
MAESATHLEATKRRVRPKKLGSAAFWGATNRAFYDSLRLMDAAARALLDENAVLKAQLAVALAKASEDMALIAAQKLQIAKLQRQIYGQKSERSARLLDQLSLELEELEANATEDELAAERAVARTTTVAGFERKRPERNTFPDHLPRERVVIEAPKACGCCAAVRACASSARM